jgi:hypothetical protein
MKFYSVTAQKENDPLSVDVRGAEFDLLDASPYVC